MLKKIYIKNGIIMISYTDFYTAEMWNNWYQLGEKVLTEKLHEEIYKLFKIKPPKPEKYKVYYWRGGVHMWRTKFPMDETMIHESPPHYSNEGYAYAKRMLEVQCRNYNKQYGRNYICVVPVNLYGEFDNFTIGEAHVIPELIHRMYNYKNNKTLKNNNEKFKAYGSGKPLRQFLYAGDFAKMILNILFFYKPGLMNIKPIICCNNEISIKELVNTIAYIMRVNLYNIEFDTSKLDGCMKKTVTNQYFNSVFPYFNYTPLYEGLEKTINWFENNYEYARK